MKIVMLGTGYVGLVSGVCFSDFGFHVTCIDKDKLKIENIYDYTFYFIINTLNQLNVDLIRNKLLLKVLPLKV